ncbi:MAG: hypothetical protein RR382_00490 [Tannerellaceae bacterium]
MFNAPVAFNSDVVINNPLSFVNGWRGSGSKKLATTKNGNPAQNAILSAVQTEVVPINFANIPLTDAFEWYAAKPSTVGINVVKKNTADQTVYHRFEYSFNVPTWAIVLIHTPMTTQRDHKSVYEFRQAANWARSSAHGTIGTPDDDTILEAPYSNPVVSGLKFFSHYNEGDPAYDPKTAVEFQSYATRTCQSGTTSLRNTVLWHFEKDWTLAQIGAGWNTGWWGYAIVEVSSAMGLFLVPTPGVFLWLAPMRCVGDLLVTGFIKNRGQDGGYSVQNPTIVYANEVSQFAPICNWVPYEPPLIDFTYNTTDVQPWQYMHFPDNAQWTLSTDTSWITLTCPLAGTGDTKGIRLTTSENTGPARYGRIRADATWMDNGSPCRAYQYLGVVQQAKPEPPPPTPAA